MRAARYEEVREKILNAAMKIFSTYGYYRAPVHLIAQEADVSKGLIFWYFNSKDKLIKEVSIRALPIDVINLCLEKNVLGRELLYCVASRYLDKYRDQMMRQLLLHTMAIANIYPEIGDKVNILCNELLKDITEKVFGEVSNESYIKIRMFFGSLLCYTTRPPTDFHKEEYIEIIIKNILRG